jgi:hypothetical protein
MISWTAGGARAVPSDFDQSGYAACPTCVIDAGDTFVVLEDVPEPQE